MDIFDYIDSYGDITFEKSKFNDVDNVVFSVLSYLDYTYTSINNSEHTLEFIGKQYLNHNDYKDIKKLGISQKLAYKTLRKVVKKKRYKDLIIHNYVYSYNKDKQFGAMMFKINDNLEYMCFEGTDELVSGWKEDFELAYCFPIPAQSDAIKYANKHIKLKGPNIIIGGHSKGGNLALVAGMYTNILKQIKIKKIYNNDGPGLRTHEYNSREFKRVKNKLVHYVPEYSLFGILLRHNSYYVIKANKKNFFAHSPGTWLINNNELIPSKLSKTSTVLQENLLVWLRNHSDSEKVRIVTELFCVFEKSNLKRFSDLPSIKNIRKVLSNARNIDDHTKDLVIDLIRFCFFNRKGNNV